MIRLLDTVALKTNVTSIHVVIPLCTGAEFPLVVELWLADIKIVGVVL